MNHAVVWIDYTKKIICCLSEIQAHLVFCILSSSPIFLVGCCFTEWSRKRQAIRSLIDPSPPYSSVPCNSPYSPANLKGPRYPDTIPLTSPHPQAHRWECPTHPLRRGHTPSVLRSLPHIWRWNPSCLWAPRELSWPLQYSPLSPVTSPGPMGLPKMPMCKAKGSRCLFLSLLSSQGLTHEGDLMFTGCWSTEVTEESTEVKRQWSSVGALHLAP